MAVRHILCIDGGGVRGIVATIVLEALEQELRAAGKSCALADCFDLIAGTSVGSIIAAGLALPAPDGGASPDPADLRRFFEEKSATIFPSRWFCNVPVIGRLPQLFGPLYDPAPLIGVLNDRLGDMVFASARRNLIVTAYSIDPRAIVLFRGGPAYQTREEAERFGMVKVRDAVAGSTAAPTFFPPHQISTPDGSRHWTAIDGGIFINDPAMAALSEAVRIFPGDEIHLTSLGTGRQTRAYPFERARRWGFSQWISPAGQFRTPLLSAMQDGQARAVNRQLKYILGTNYVRFDYDLSTGLGSDQLDDASKRNIARLSKGAEQMVKNMRPALRDLATQLEPCAAE